VSDFRIRAITIGGSVLILFLILELVRRRKLKEEYSLLWVLTAVALLVLSVWYGLLAKITELIGAAMPASTLFFFGLVFVIVLLLHFSVRISSLERRMTALIQEIGIMSVELGPEPPPGHTELQTAEEQPAILRAESSPERTRYER
jgi:hypothetical protein